MAQNKQKDSDVSDSDSKSLPYYNELSEEFHEMHDDALKAFKKISSQKKNILKLEGEILKLQNSLESLKEDHASLVND